jgi:GT2 family glycosyltransferase
MAIAFWYVARRRLRARNQLHEAASALFPSYETWIQLVERAETDALVAGLLNTNRNTAPLFSLWIHAPGWSGARALERTLASIRAQFCCDWELIVTGEMSSAVTADKSFLKHIPASGQNQAAALSSALAAANGEFLIVVPPDAILPYGAVARYRHAALDAIGTTIFYGDEDVIDFAGRRARPWFKPQWNAELILAQDYVSHACAIAMPAARAVNEISADLAGCVGYALLLAAASRPGAEVRHIAHVLCHLPDRPGADDADARLRAVSQHIEDVGGIAQAGPFGTVRISWPLPAVLPSVTIIIPTRDRVDLLEACVGSLLRETRYPHYDVLIVDNGSTESSTHDWLMTISSDPRVSVLSYDHPYNFSAINNFAAAHAKGEYLCLLNNDTEIVDGAWLEELMRYAIRRHVGAVGAKLLYDDGSIQHAGVVIGLGNAAGHSHRALPNGQEGYFAQAHCAHYASAVTAACLVVERAKFEAVGGLDEVDLQIAYNDVDFCLKLVRNGWQNVYAPQAVLIHYESKSRGQDMAPQHIDRYKRELAILQERWDTHVLTDPMHHPRLDRASEIYRIRL